MEVVAPVITSLISVKTSTNPTVIEPIPRPSENLLSINLISYSVSKGSLGLNLKKDSLRKSSVSTTNSPQSLSDDTKDVLNPSLANEFLSKINEF